MSLEISNNCEILYLIVDNRICDLYCDDGIKVFNVEHIERHTTKYKSGGYSNNLININHKKNLQVFIEKINKLIEIINKSYYVGGAGNIKNILKHTDFCKGIYNTSYTGDFGIQELKEKIGVLKNE